MALTPPLDRHGDRICYILLINANIEMKPEAAATVAALRTSSAMKVRKMHGSVMLMM